MALNSSNHATADLLLMLWAEEQRIATAEYQKKMAPAFRFTSDGLPALSGLIVSGLIEISRRYSGANAWAGGMPSFEVMLTEQGRRLVTAWREGSADLGAALVSLPK